MLDLPKKRNTKPRKLPSQQRAIENVERILNAAVSVLEEHGYDHLKTVTIAEKAGCSVGSVYQYFPNKHAIMVQLVERWNAEDNAALDAVESKRDQYDTVVDQFIDLAKLLIESYEGQKGLVSLVNLIHNIPELHDMTEVHDKQYARRLAQIFSEYGLKADDKERFALAGYYTIIVDAAAMSIAMETSDRAKLKTKFILNSVRDLFSHYL